MTTAAPPKKVTSISAMLDAQAAGEQSNQSAGAENPGEMREGNPPAAALGGVAAGTPVAFVKPPSQEPLDYDLEIEAGKLPVGIYCYVDFENEFFVVSGIGKHSVNLRDSKKYDRNTSLSMKVFVRSEDYAEATREAADNPDNEFTNPAAAHRTVIRIDGKHYPCRISEKLNAMPDWRGEPEYERLVASAKRDGKFLQPVLGKLTPVGNSAWPVMTFEVEDGRHRLWAGEEAGLDFVEGKLTDMAVEELMLRSLLERRHLEKGARAYLAWPVIAPFVSANKEARAARGKANLKRSKEKGEPVRNPTSGISESETLLDILDGQIPEADAKRFKELAESYGIGHTLLDQARRVHEIFARRKDLKAEHEADILSGEQGMGAFLAGVAGREATEGKGRKDTPPADLLRRSFRDLGIRFAADRWSAVPADERPKVAGELVETVLNLPEDVRERLKLALAS